VTDKNNWHTDSEDICTRLYKKSIEKQNKIGDYFRARIDLSTICHNHGSWAVATVLYYTR